MLCDSHLNTAPINIVSEKETPTIAYAAAEITAHAFLSQMCPWEQ